MKHINSGYVIIDAGGLDLSSSDPQTIAGAWTMVQDAVATKKPIVEEWKCPYHNGRMCLRMIENA